MNISNNFELNIELDFVTCEKGFISDIIPTLNPTCQFGFNEWNIFPFIVFPRVMISVQNVEIQVLFSRYRNSVNMLFKGVAWVYTGSHSMFAEAVHSLADTLNQVFILR